MAIPQEKLASSLEALKALQDETNQLVIRGNYHGSTDMSVADK